jgi:hypothetical protein
MCNEQWIDLHRMDMMNLFMHLVGEGAFSWANLQDYIIFIQFQAADNFSGDIGVPEEILAPFFPEWVFHEAGFTLIF